MKLKCKEIEERFSCRFFDETKRVPDDIIEAILYAASMAPSGKNLQPWRFRVIADTSFGEKLADILAANKWLKLHSEFILVYLDPKSSYDGIKDYMSIGAAIQNMLIEARHHGIDTCWIGECTDYSDEISVLAGVRPEYKLLAAIAVGYSKRTFKSPGRKKLDELII